MSIRRPVNSIQLGKARDPEVAVMLGRWFNGIGSLACSLLDRIDRSC